MYVVALNRRKIINTAKIVLLIALVFAIVLVIFNQLPNYISLEKWNAAQDHPGRILRVDFDQSTGVDKTIQQLKRYYQGTIKSH